MNGRVLVTITGKVQGVFFRASTEKEALRLGLTGYVKNLASKPDKEDKVQALFEGEIDTIKTMIEWCRRGPENASVTELTTKWENSNNEHRTFTIQY